MVEAQITRYTVDENGNRNGCLVAAKIDGEVRIGFSKCHKKDDFNKQLGRRMAIGRMVAHPPTTIRKMIPWSIENEFSRFEDRLVKYFKN